MQKCGMCNLKTDKTHLLHNLALSCPFFQLYSNYRVSLLKVSYMYHCNLLFFLLQHTMGWSQFSKGLKVVCISHLFEKFFLSPAFLCKKNILHRNPFFSQFGITNMTTYKIFPLFSHAMLSITNF